MLDYTASLSRVLDFPATAELHGAPGNPWTIPLLAGVPRACGNIQSEIEMLIFVWALIVMLKPELVIETGTDAGTMTRAMGLACQANGRGRVMTAEIDGGLVEHARKFCEGLPVEVHHGPALELPIEQADVLFLDSSYESRKQELKRVKPGAVAILHDTDREPSMADALSEHVRVIRIRTPRGFALVQE